MTWIGEDERLLHETPEEIQDVQRIDRVTGADRLGRLERTPRREDRQPSEDGPLRLGQEVVAPVDRGAQRLMPRDRRPASAGQEAEAVVEACCDLLDRERPDPSRGELDRQRDPVQAAAD